MATGRLESGQRIGTVVAMVKAVPCGDGWLDGNYELVGPTGQTPAFFNPRLFNPPDWLCERFHRCNIIIKQGLLSDGWFDRHISKVEPVEEKDAILSL